MGPSPGLTEFDLFGHPIEDEAPLLETEVLQLEYRDPRIRGVLVKSEPWLVAQDACRVLEIENSRHAYSRIDDEKGVHNMDTLGGRQSLQIINESGLYSLAFYSRNPQAKALTYARLGDAGILLRVARRDSRSCGPASGVRGACPSPAGVLPDPGP